jgi:hypothetical protein
MYGESLEIQNSSSSMIHDQAHEPVASSGDRDQRAYDDEDVRRSGATVFFWVVLTLLICLGICVLASIVLALIYGS